MPAARPSLSVNSSPDHVCCVHRRQAAWPQPPRRIVLSLLVRFCCRAAGLGGGVSPVLAASLLSQLSTFTLPSKTPPISPKPPANVAVGAAGAPAATAGGQADHAAVLSSALMDARRRLEVLNPVLGSPAMKGGVLAEKGAGILAGLMGRLARGCAEEEQLGELLAVVELALEAAEKLFDWVGARGWEAAPFTCK